MNGNIPAREITPRETFLSRRRLLQTLGIGASVAATGGVYAWLADPGPSPYRTSGRGPREGDGGGEAVSIADTLTPPETFTHYNNYYEFSTDKRDPALLAAGFKPRPWSVTVDGRVAKPRTLDLDQLLSLAPAEERVYRHRCVEGWSMVIPWLGFPLAALLKAAEPLAGAKFVAFTSLLDPARMPGQKSSVLRWPYVEGLRMEEAMHPLTLLSHGAYGEALLPQNGAPLHLVIPWKYGFKGAKAIVRITLVDTQPATTWNLYSPADYGFYSNVNPSITRPRFSQRFEDRLGETVDRRPTLAFNGYAEQVADLYRGMDLAKDY